MLQEILPHQHEKAELSVKFAINIFSLVGE